MLNSIARHLKDVEDFHMIEQVSSDTWISRERF